MSGDGFPIGRDSPAPLGLYLHVPFCTRRCDYCDFFVVVGRDDLHEAYVARLCRSIADGARSLAMERDAAGSGSRAAGRPGSPSGPGERGGRRDVSGAPRAGSPGDGEGARAGANDMGGSSRAGISAAGAERPAGSGVSRERPRADTIYIGGGTPSLLDARRIGRLLDACRASFDLDARAEITMEANPEGIDEERLAGWLAAGVNRLSIGIQSIRDATLRARGRLHTGAAGLEAVTAAREAGFRNIGVDLIAGLPPGRGRDGEGGAAGSVVVAEMIDAAVAIVARRPEHVSLYLHETDKDTPLMAAARAGRVVLPDDDEAAEAFEAARDILVGAGYEHYEISSFCRPGMRSRHNLKYWRGEPWIGFGPSAASMLDGRLSTRPRDIEAFMEGRDTPADQAPPTPEGAAREALVMSLRLLEGVDMAAFDRRWGTSLESELRATIGELVEAGCVSWEGARLRLTERGVLLANELFTRVTEGPRGR